MSIQVGTPTYDNVNKCYQLSVENAPTLEAASTSGIVFEGGVQETFMTFVGEFLKLASPYFSKPLNQDIFLQRVVHMYNPGDYNSEPETPIQKVFWIPAHVTFYPNKYEIHWTIVGIQKNISPGTDIVDIGSDILSSDALPPPRMIPKPTIQKLLRQRIRQARLKCALARLRVEQLAERYYARYGNFDGLSDADSELSSDSEFNPNEPPRKI